MSIGAVHAAPTSPVQVTNVAPVRRDNDGDANDKGAAPSRPSPPAGMGGVVDVDA